MDDNKKLLYEKIADISETKSQLIKENKDLKKKLDEYQETIFKDFCEFVDALVEKVDLNKEDIDEMFGGKTDEEKMAKYFIRAIKQKASDLNVDPVKVAEYIIRKIKGRY